MLFVDTSALIAIEREPDENHVRATELFEGAGDRFLITDHVLGEVVTLLTKRDGRQIALVSAERLLNNEQFEITYNNQDRTGQALELVRRQAGLSFCDALSVVVMQERGIRDILSFDSDFDKVKGLVRIH